MWSRAVPTSRGSLRLSRGLLPRGDVGQDMLVGEGLGGREAGRTWGRRAL